MQSFLALANDTDTVFAVLERFGLADVGPNASRQGTARDSKRVSAAVARRTPLHAAHSTRWYTQNVTPDASACVVATYARRHHQIRSELRYPQAYKRPYNAKTRLITTATNTDTMQRIMGHRLHNRFATQQWL